MAQVQASTSRAGSFEEVSRLWRSGDTIEISLPFCLRTEGFRDNPNRRAFLHGPLVLAAEIDPRGPIPAIVADAASEISSLKPLAGKPSTFTSSPSVFRQAGKAAEANLTLEPFYKVHGARHYVVYWDLYTPSEWQAREAEHAAELARAQGSRRANRRPGHAGPGAKRESTSARGRKYPDRRLRDRIWRDAAEGWFRYVVTVRPDRAQELSVTYWGSDSGGRVFDVLVDGTRLATERLRSEITPRVL